MRAFLLEAAIALFAALLLMAIVFRSTWARDMLRFVLRALWLWVGLVVLIAVFRVWQQGGVW